MKILFIILFIGWSFTQSTSLSLYGVGDKSNVTDVTTIALGNSTFFSGNKYNISTNSSSSLWRSSLTRFTIHSGMNYLTNPQIWGSSIIRAVNERIQNGDIKMEVITNEKWPSYLTRVL